jgi:hypothetical protein
MRIRHSVIGLIVLTLVALPLARAADPKVDTSKLPSPASRTGVTFDKDIKPLVDRSCAKCHGGDRPKARYVVGTREGVLKGGDSEKAAVVPGKSAESPLVHYVADLVLDMEMPPTDKRDEYPALTKDEIALVRAWIDQGAK